MTNSKFGGKPNGARRGGDSAWKQHRGDGELSNTEARRIADERFALATMVDEAGDEPYVSPITETGGKSGTFYTDGVAVTLSYGEGGRIIAAHCQSVRGRD